MALGLSPIASRPICGEFADIADAGSYSAPYLVAFDEKAPSQRSRRHEQQVADVLNSLLRGGGLTGGTPSQAALGYRIENPDDWDGANDQVVVPLQDAITSIAEALAALGQKPNLP